MDNQDTSEPQEQETLDALTESIHKHPLAEQIFDLAAQSNIDLSDIASVAEVLSHIDDADLADVRSLLLFSLVLERLVNHEQLLSADETHQEKEASEQE